MNMKISHFKYNPEQKIVPRKSILKRVSSAKTMEKNKVEIFKTINVSQFFAQAKHDIKKSSKKPIVQSVLKNSNEKIREKVKKIKRIIEQNINREEIMLIKDKNDIDYEQILAYQEQCESELESLFNEKMKKIFELRNNTTDELRLSQITNFDSNDEISFRSIPEQNKEKIDEEYDEKYSEVFYKYISHFDDMDDIKRINLIYMGYIYDNLIKKINSILYPRKNIRVKFN